LLADANHDLINLYSRLRNGGETFISACETLFTVEANTRPVYDARRQQFNGSRDGEERAKLFVYLNKHCYNGLCRFNSRGEFNVPFGRYAHVGFPELEMQSFAVRAQAAELVCADFVHVMGQARRGDVVYCDPPYVPLSGTAHFTSYSAGGFGPDQQEALARAATELAQRGVTVLISNHDTEWTRRLYHQADHLEAFGVRRHISCDGASRSDAKELLALFMPKGY
jgi:DNA adenine methylase